MLNSFNLKLQFKDTEYAIKNRLINLLTEIKSFEFVKRLVFEFKKIQSDDKMLYSTFH